MRPSVLISEGEDKILSRNPSFLVIDEDGGLPPLVERDPLAATPLLIVKHRDVFGATFGMSRDHKPRIRDEISGRIWLSGIKESHGGEAAQLANQSLIRTVVV